ncbi:hypothetical protein QF034_000485 [Streptomyces africanus]|uniref:Uncharacterized protein n=1 Tax=Streptomyces africanus TaxID=231024 RepID=A0ABU0QFV1_9ACTN|nr:hypothetical protein [Streptomyces africanus]
MRHPRSPRERSVEPGRHGRSKATERGRDHGSTFDMHRLLHFAKEQGHQERLLDLLYRANFAEERSVFRFALASTSKRGGVRSGPGRHSSPSGGMP